ncbi:LuxR C-terminal-related transcriptional regulator [Sphingobacterium pedocola]|uniref:Helix-turn-helix transcriptional regulator n=1 Tax=Sphingobacterium pedocola TaxID=2082722 RepID=A0ABR9TA54_9SPHI|nr:LuxR C-terminal-related transcriptional regulator [Sphingobacterium pedocola]MBE8722225.1 helix-turn-helix transcriptional regulator [Sphingobacterium pedocola]
MESDNHVLAPVWEKYPEIFSPEKALVDADDILQLISEIFVVGNYYYYLIDIMTKELSHHLPNICDIHGFDAIPIHLQQIIDLIHPEDIQFVLRAEELCYGKIVQIGAKHVKSLKSGYCFRMRMADGSYHLFHHQAVSLVVDKQNRIAKSLNIHTDIQHLTQQNNYIATIIGINGRTDFHQIDLSTRPAKHGQKSPLTKRELEILPLIAKGLSSTAIAQRLGISVQTVRVHRKNILKKTETTTSGSMIKKCIEEGLL